MLVVFGKCSRHVIAAQPRDLVLVRGEDLQPRPRARAGLACPSRHLGMPGSIRLPADFEPAPLAKFPRPVSRIRQILLSRQLQCRNFVKFKQNVTTMGFSCTALIDSASREKCSHLSFAPNLAKIRPPQCWIKTYVFHATPNIEIADSFPTVRFPHLFA